MFQLVDERAGWGLRKDLSDIARRDNRANPRRIPAHAGLEKDGDIRPHAVLDVGEYEVERRERTDAVRLRVVCGCI